MLVVILASLFLFFHDFEHLVTVQASYFIESLSFFNVCLFILRGSTHAHELERDRERERILSRLRISSAEPNAGFELTNPEIMT